jgi:bifunctional ADP-heptose synthase (sugar kinase/adenylyltransferase)
MGDRLVVALTSDESVRREKGKNKPFHTWEERAEALRELRCVSEVVKSESGMDAILRTMPQVFAKGVDYRDAGVGLGVRELCKAFGIEVVYTDTPKLSSRDTEEAIRASR